MHSGHPQARQITTIVQSTQLNAARMPALRPPDRVGGSSERGRRALESSPDTACRYQYCAGRRVHPTLPRRFLWKSHAAPWRLGPGKTRPPQAPAGGAQEVFDTRLRGALSLDVGAVAVGGGSPLPAGHTRATGSNLASGRTRGGAWGPCPPDACAAGRPPERLFLLCAERHQSAQAVRSERV